MKAADYRRRVPEHDLQKQVLEVIALQSKSAFAFAVPNAAMRSPALAARMKAEGLMSGVADLCVMLPEGKAGWLELKTATGRQSETQRTFEIVCIGLDHPYALVRSLDEAIAVLKSWGALT
jgi:hypothetical protein